VRFISFFYAWIPVVLIGTVVILALPWLALIALVAVVLAIVAVLGSLAWAIVAAFNGLGHSVRSLSSSNPS
jgi:hypothetical protein